MTKKEMFNMIATVNADNQEIVDFCEKEIALLEKRKSSPKGQTKTQKENESIKAIILEALETSGDKMTVSELLKCEGLDYSNQKISALLRQLVEVGKVEKIMEGKKAYFSIVGEGE